MKRKFKVREDLFTLEVPGGYADKIETGSGFLDCSLGTNPFGTSEKVKEKLKDLDIDLSAYPDVRYTHLRNALAGYWDIDEESIFFGAGTIGCFEKVNKFVMTQGSKVLGISPQYTRYISDVLAMGGFYEAVPLKKENRFKIDVGEVVNALNSDYSLFYLDNPHNPTGQALRLKEVEEIVQDAERKGVLVLVDEAYGDFIEKEESAINLDYDNLIVIRSFSKGFGLASMRIGYAVIKNRNLGELYRKVDLPFPISRIGEILAVEALNDEKFLNESRKKVAFIKKKIINALKREFQIAETHMQTPIMLLWGSGDTYHYFLQKKILTVRGSVFRPLDDSYVRLRVPEKAEELLSRLF